MGRDLSLRLLRNLGELNLAVSEGAAELRFVILLCEPVNSSDLEFATVCLDRLTRENLVTSQVVISYLSLARLAHCKAEWQSSPFKEEREIVSAIVGVVYFPDFEGVVSQVVVDDVWKIILGGVKPKDFAIIIKELLLRHDAAAT